nr:hypothetical protein [uncultured Pedobacter sp.]
MERRRVLSLLLIIGIVGYFTVPTIASYIVHAGGANTLLQKVTNMVVGGGSGMLTSGTDRMVSGVGNIASAAGNYQEGYSGKSDGSGAHGAAGRAIGGTGAYLSDKLSGK